MTTLDHYFDLWAEDSKIDRTELGEESIKIPQLHHKYYKMYSLERLNLVRLQEEMKILKKDKIEYYTGTMAEDDLKERGWEPNPLRILKTDIPVHMEADKDFVDLNLKLAYNKEKVEFLEAVVKTLNIRSYQINNAINWEKFKVGV
tara:strand:- start:12933 stop:13370 length:438 start_codon:yes stop_codon:yes gene_type:complete